MVAGQGLFERLAQAAAVLGLLQVEEIHDDDAVDGYIEFVGQIAYTMEGSDLVITILQGTPLTEARDNGPDEPIDLLWSNPPVRIGKDELYRLLDSWLDRLAPNGLAVLVMSKNLGGDSLHRHLEERGHPVERLGSKAGYRVLAVRPTNSIIGA